MVRLEGFEPPTLGSEDCSDAFAHVSPCPNMQVTASVLSSDVRHRSPMFESFIPISFPLCDHLSISRILDRRAIEAFFYLVRVFVTLASRELLSRRNSFHIEVDFSLWCNGASKQSSNV
jgi:hypothetical protein